jgi:hypothetical protein
MAPDCGRVNHHAEPGWRDLPATRPQGPKSRSAAGLRLVFPAGRIGNRELESGIPCFPNSGRVGNRGVPPRFPANLKSGIWGTGIGDFRVWA